MRRACPEYERLLRAYERVFVAWVGSSNLQETSNLQENGAVAGRLNKLEKKYQALTDHQQSCRACLDKLGRAGVQDL
jgi:hypothetical protein